MSRIYQIEQPSSALNKSLHDIPLEDNAVLLSGECSDLGVISQGKLFSWTGYSFQALYENTTNGFTTEFFPIGSHIYVYMGTEFLNDELVNNLKAYDSYYEVPLSNNGIPIDHGFSENFSNYDGVWLEVQLNSTHTAWKPLDIIGTTGLHSKRLYIYLGSYTGNVQSQSQADADKFMLETKNELYYMETNGTMTPYYLWEMNNQIGWIEAQLAAI